MEEPFMIQAIQSCFLMAVDTSVTHDRAPCPDFESKTKLHATIERLLREVDERHALIRELSNEVDDGGPPSKKRRISSVSSETAPNAPSSMIIVQSESPPSPISHTSASSRATSTSAGTAASSGSDAIDLTTTTVSIPPPFPNQTATPNLDLAVERSVNLKLQKAVVRLQAELDGEKNELGNQKITITRLNRLNQQLQSSLAAVETALDEERTHADALRKSLAVYEDAPLIGRIRELKKVVGTRDAQMLFRDGVQQRQDEQIRKLNETITRLKWEVVQKNKVQADLATLKKELAAKTKAIDELQQRQARFIERSLLFDQQEGIIRTQANAILHQNQVLQKRYEVNQAQAQQISSLRAEVEKLHHQVTHTINERNHLRNQLACQPNVNQHVEQQIQGRLAAQEQEWSRKLEETRRGVARRVEDACIDVSGELWTTIIRLETEKAELEQRLGSGPIGNGSQSGEGAKFNALEKWKEELIQRLESACKKRDTQSEMGEESDKLRATIKRLEEEKDDLVRMLQHSSAEQGSHAASSTGSGQALQNLATPTAQIQPPPVAPPPIQLIQTRPLRPAFGASPQMPSGLMTPGSRSTSAATAPSRHPSISASPPIQNQSIGTAPQTCQPTPASGSKNTGPSAIPPGTDPRHPLTVSPSPPMHPQTLSIPPQSFQPTPSGLMTPGPEARILQVGPPQAAAFLQAQKASPVVEKAADFDALFFL
ncbi:hypothetical protein BJ508DRAFT_335979 [Ascobolus immersus RN42]|uniref:Uncharacterized protein n=1 Tax=Ascobolus immersus RN42 TaxID=1160509 RepID=A0A3N4HF11_ASCIM|nr:hypothetical protein BJ508DRAFT_335979 [Ascobolus immersus RN42]